MIITGNKAPRIISFENKITGTGVFDVDEVVIEQGELVTNGTFYTDTTGWTNISSTSAIVDHSVALTNTVSWGKLHRAITLTAGRRYKLSGWGKSGSGEALYVSVRNDPLSATNIVGLSFTSTSWEYKEATFTNTDGDTIILFNGNNLTTNYFKNISVVEIPALPSLTTGTKQLKCTAGGTIQFYTHGATRLRFDFMDASANTWTHYDDYISNLSFASITNNILTLTLSTDDILFNIYYS